MVQPGLGVFSVDFPSQGCDVAGEHDGDGLPAFGPVDLGDGGQEVVGRAGVKQGHKAAGSDRAQRVFRWEGSGRMVRAATGNRPAPSVLDIAAARGQVEQVRGLDPVWWTRPLLRNYVPRGGEVDVAGCIGGGDLRADRNLGRGNCVRA